MAKTFHLDLGPFGFEEQWVDLRDPKYMTNRRMKRLAKAKDDPNAGEEFLRGLIVAWHVLDGDGDEPLGEPATDDFDGLSIGVTAAIGRTFTELTEAIVPNALRKS